MSDVAPVQSIPDKSKTMDFKYCSVSKVQPASVQTDRSKLDSVEEEPKLNLVDLFEYVDICWQHDKKNGHKLSQSVMWTMLKYLGVSDCLSLRQLCRASSRFANKDMQRTLIVYGNLEDNLRANFWI